MACNSSTCFRDGTFRMLNLLAALLSLAGVVVSSMPINYLAFMYPVEMFGCSSWGLVHTKCVDADFHPFRLLIVANGVNAFHHLIAFVFFPWYDAQTQVSNWLRWTEYAVTASCMNVLVAYLCGLQSQPVLVLVGVIVAAMMLLGYGLERYRSDDGAGLVMGAAWFLFAGLWITIGVSFIESSRDTAMPDFVYAVVFTMAACFVSFGLVAWYDFRNTRTAADFRRVNVYYVFLSLLAKQLLTWLVYGGLAAQSMDDEEHPYP